MKFNLLILSALFILSLSACSEEDSTFDSIETSLETEIISQDSAVEGMEGDEDEVDKP